VGNQDFGYKKARLPLYGRKHIEADEQSKNKGERDSIDIE
jgi:hypothetical protein